MICIFTCWTCSKKLDPEETTEEYFFWCDRECYDKDDRYHNREKVVDPKPKIADATPKNEKEQRKSKIRAALAQINGTHKD
ncbi:MAG: hypothetical protein K9G65_05830 [Rickettsiaceae bacterium]|jgi:hypothetical protein|nr:hypothetical protein [Rickettsiaceae bacterium]